MEAMNTTTSPDDDYIFPIENVISYQKKYYLNFVLATCTNLYGIFLILRKSPKEMSTYRWFLLNILLNSYVLDVYLTVVLQMYFLFPIPGICSTGLMQYLNSVLAIGGGIAILAELSGIMGVSILFAQFYRLAALYGFQQHLIRKKNLAVVLVLHLGYAVPLLVVYGFGVHENYHQNELIVEAYNNFTGIRDILNDYTCAFMPTERTFVRATLIAMCVWIIFTSLVGLLMVVFGFVSLAMKKRSMSDRAYKMHLQLSLSLVVQIFLPLLTVCFPFIFAVVCLLFQLPHLKAVAQIYGLLLGSHSFLNALIMTISIGPYRHATVNYLRCILRLVKWKCLRSNRTSAVIVPEHHHHHHHHVNIRIARVKIPTLNLSIS